MPVLGSGKIAGRRALDGVLHRDGALGEGFFLLFFFFRARGNKLSADGAGEVGSGRQGINRTKC